MALNDNRDDNLERDPQLARLYQAVVGEEPPAALDAAILAAARREVGARPQAAGERGGATAPVLHRKRSWYLPLSLAAVLVLSVSVVILVHDEKGDELAQPPRVASEPANRSAAGPASTPPAAAPVAASDAASGPTPQIAKSDALTSDAASAKAKIAQEPPTTLDKAVSAPAAAEGAGVLAKKQRPEKEIAATMADSVTTTTGGERKDQPAAATAQAAKAGAAPGLISGGPSSGTPPPAPMASMGERRPEPFPGANEREAVAQTSKDAIQARARSEADRAVMRGMAREAARAPTEPSSPPAAVAATPRPAPALEDSQKQSALPQAEGRVQAAPPPPPAAKPAPPPPATPAARLSPRAPIWRGLEEQPPEKWLDRIAEFKRDGRQADVDTLLTEFRRRFPDHPASAR